ncbi:Non-histone chromosomal protein 6 [Coemansia erecta]|uniref:Non-histone chromosomal protein 6 n=1 Tax=Coemansia asiatica TaxID=1052880 RepID=A0A9W8CKZ9_9FUNG|nr:Non-histone chromosomal protein 6 [Coemansia asiatica]KAJ2839950.1 Non-histone chromosomal protein 6 [Coemansia erecta]KAJ2881474.1 Non-histone chromosomal protein 6 [Coemansia asiatica]
MARQSKTAAAPAKATKATKGAKNAKTTKVSKADTARVTKKAKRAKKDPNAPKRALSAYMFFSQAKRQAVKDDNPTASFGNIGKILGNMWSTMSDNDKAPFIKRANDDKKRYDAEKAAYAGNEASAEESD